MEEPIQLSFYNHNGVRLWSIDRPDSKYLDAGLIIGGLVCLFVTDNTRNYFEFEYNNHVMHGGRMQLELIRQRVDNILTINNGLLSYNEVRAENIPLNVITHISTVNKFRYNFGCCIWIRSPRTMTFSPEYNLYEFETIRDMEEFLQGVLTMCDAFNVDPNESILACPLYDGYPHYIEGVNLPILPADEGGSPTDPLDEAGTTFPTLPYDQGGNLIDEMEEFYNNNELMDEEYNYNYPWHLKY